MHDKLSDAETPGMVETHKQSMLLIERVKYMWNLLANPSLIPPLNITITQKYFRARHNHSIKLFVAFS